MRSMSFVKSPQRMVFSSTIRVADGVGCHALLQGVFPTQGSSPGLLHCRQILYHLSHQVSPRILEWVAYPFCRGSSQPRNWNRVSCIAGGFFTSWATREAQCMLQICTNYTQGFQVAIYTLHCVCVLSC